jgi:UDP-3-O-[3-hydroxymyristoyl] glucosamine N-acyltransferase
MKIRDIIARLGGKCVGDDTIDVTAVNAVEFAKPGEITFAGGPRWLPAAEKSGASVVVVPANIPTSSKTIIQAPDVLAYTAGLIQVLHPEPGPPAGIHPAAVIAADVKLGNNVSIAANAVIEERTVLDDGCVVGPGVWIGADCVVGEKTRIHGNASLYPRTRVGRRCLIHSGAVLGADGFRFIPGAAGPQKVPQIGYVRIDDDVEVGANSCIDRAAFGVTHVMQSVKIDNLVQIGHNCIVGPGSILVGQCALAGSARLGRGVMVGGQVGVSDHVVVGDGAKVAGGSGVHEDIPPGEQWAGYPAVPVLQAATEIRSRRWLHKNIDTLRRMVEREAAPTDRKS